jgi:hypothetical protein
VLAEDSFLMPAMAADVQAHVLDDPEHGHVNLLEHLEPFARIGQRDVLRRRDDDRSADGNALSERQLDIAGSGRHVDDQVVEIAPAGLRQQLVEGRRHHRPAPGHRLLLVDEEADRHGLEAMRDERLEQLAVARLRPPPREAQHARLARPVDVRVEQADLRALGGEREREIHGDGRLADAALAGSHGDQIIDAGQRLQAVLNSVRHDRARDRELDRRPGEGLGAVHAQGFRQCMAARGEWEPEPQRDVPRSAVALELERGAGPTERSARVRNDEAAEGLLEI